MKKMLCVMLLSVCVSLTHGATIVSVIGDNDGFNPGDPEDVPPRSQTLLDAFSNIGNASPLDLDIWFDNTSGKGFSHLFSIPDGQTIVSATLTVAVYWERSGEHDGSDKLHLDDIVGGLADGSLPWGDQGARTQIDDILGFVNGFGTTEVVIDLSSVPVRPNVSGSPSNFNLLSELLDGEFNVIVIGQECDQHVSQPIIDNSSCIKDSSSVTFLIKFLQEL